MITFNSNVRIEGNDYFAGNSVESVPEEVKNHWYYKHLVEIGDIIESEPAKISRAKG